MPGGSFYFSIQRRNYEKYSYFCFRYDHRQRQGSQLHAGILRLPVAHRPAAYSGTLHDSGAGYGRARTLLHCERIAASGIHVALATAYNTLQLLVDAGIVLRHRFGDRTSLYECVHEASGHQHLICSQCGKVKEVRDTSLAGYLRTKRYPSFTPTCYSLSIYGLCSECARKERRSAAAPSKKTESTPNNT